VLNGWTTAGTRPKFTVVSGVSTGGLIAPFAFLGPAYDGRLREVYTSGIAESLLDAPSILNALFGSGLFGNSRLRELVARYVDQNMLAAIAEEHAKGRDLLIVTTDLDTQRTAVWDMGRIAAVGSPQALSLFRDVVAASASIPVVFPPMMIDAEANGNHFQEMHVDGGVTAPVLTLPEAFILRNGAFVRGLRITIYILINNKVERDFQLVPNSTIDIAARASASVTKTQTRSIQAPPALKRTTCVLFISTDMTRPKPVIFGSRCRHRMMSHQAGSGLKVPRCSGGLQITCERSSAGARGEIVEALARLSYRGSDDQGLWTTAWRGSASRKRSGDRYSCIAHSGYSSYRDPMR
jgi:predicted acylesterase/phospholipase RssA